MRGFKYDVYVMDTDGQYEIGSHTQRLVGTGSGIKKGDVVVFEGRANDGTDWWYHNYVRGKYLMGEKTKIGVVDYVSEKGKMLLNSLRIYQHGKSLDWQKELRALVEEDQEG